MSKLPQEIKLLLTRKFGKDVWAIDKLLEALQQEVEAREKVLLTENEGVENYENLMSTGRPTDSNRRQPFRTFPCVYCGNASHKAYQCSKISKPESRKDFLIKQKRCFNQLSYVTPKLSRKLNLKQIGKKELCIQSFGNNKTVKTLPLVEFNVKTSKGQVPVQAYVSEISQPVSRQNTVECQKRFEHLKGLKLADPNHEKAIDIDILIGSNFYWDFIHTEGAVTGKSGQPIALTVISENDRLSETVDKFWDLESLGIKCENFDTEKREFVKEFENSLKFNEKEKMYEATYPVKEENWLLGDNYELCRKRLQCLSKSFENNQQLLKDYQKIFNEQLTKGVIEKAPNDQEVGKTHYIPHHAVIKPEKSTTKVRIVYDASAKANNNELFSLNECLEAGPPLNTDLFEILLRFSNRQSRHCR
ncbi:uncharacterized protein [Clytia hemisphaerica]|uniref:uncharacterized protein n=1 Tax=Clytia hemisphaerica TaxID=252671 RepID=UPI0034D63752